MENIELNSYAKINLSLEVINKREDNYHNIDTIMQEISLKDIVRLEKRESDIVIESNSKDIPLNEDNLAYKACQEVMHYVNRKLGVYIYIEKNIPVAAGLAGGSSNAAVCIKGLNTLYDLGLSLNQMKEIGRKLGADIAFCLEGGTKRAVGIGDDLSYIGEYKDLAILIANPSIAISTPEVYKALNMGQKKQVSHMDKLEAFLKKRDIKGLCENMVNSMEDIVIENYPVVGEIKKTMLDNGALGSLMSGSGATIFAIFDKEEKLEKCYRILKEDFDKVYIARTR